MGAAISFLLRLMWGRLPPKRVALAPLCSEERYDPLPDELWLRVYALLGPRDRDALRRSLPPRMLRRLSLPLSQDRKLLALDYAFRHGLVDAAVPLNVFRFLTRHAGEPGVLAMAREHGVDLGATGEAKSKVIGAVENLQDRIRLDAVTPADLELLTDADLEDYKKILHITLALSASKPSAFDAVFADARVAKAFDAAHSPGSIASHNFIFHTVNMLNEPLLTHVVKLPHPFTRSALEEVRKPGNTLLFANDAAKVLMLLKHCDLPPETRSAMMRAAVNTHLNADVVAILARAM